MITVLVDDNTNLFLCYLRIAILAY